MMASDPSHLVAQVGAEIGEQVWIEGERLSGLPIGDSYFGPSTHRIYRAGTVQLRLSLSSGLGDRVTAATRWYVAALVSPINRSCRDRIEATLRGFP